MPSVDEIKAQLGLAPHPTCGFTALTYQSLNEIPKDALPDRYSGSRPYASVLYFLVTPDRATQLHRIRSDQMYHHYLGDPLEVLMLYPDGRGEVVFVGSDLVSGMKPQLLIPADTWHISRVADGGEYSLLGTTEWPGFDPDDLELASATKLISEYPDFADQITRFVDSPTADYEIRSR